MSEYDKLFMDYTKKLDKLNTTFFVNLDKIQKECKHEQTHWMQELDKKGNFKDELYKRCLICGATVTKLDGSREEDIEAAMKAFDMIIENRLNQSEESSNGENKK